MDGLQILCWVLACIFIYIPSAIGVAAQAEEKIKDKAKFNKAEADAKWNAMIKAKEERLARGEKYTRVC